MDNSLPYILHQQLSRKAIYFFFILFSIFCFLCPAHLVGQQVSPDSSTAGSDSLKRVNRVEPFAVDHDTLHSLANYDSTKPDSAIKTEKQYKHSPLKAGLFSAILPGLGQAYNKKYWKIPIVYAGLGGLGYALYITSTNFKGFRAAYRQQVATIPNPYASYLGVSDASTLKVYRDYYKKYLDISAIGMGAWYALSIIDAVVDAHLMDWNMKDDLSVSWHPLIGPTPDYNSLALGAALTFNF